MSRWKMIAGQAQAGEGRDREKVGRKIGLEVSGTDKDRPGYLRPAKKQSLIHSLELGREK